MSRSARKATARRIWLTARLILATRGAGQRALNSPRRRRIRERPGRGARQREDEQAEAHPYGLAHPAHQAERDGRRRSEAERGERDHIAALEGAEARRDQERSEADRGAERLDHGGRRQRDGDAQELQDQPGLERAKQPRDQMEGDREDGPPGSGLVETREHVVDAPERLGAGAGVAGWKASPASRTPRRGRKATPSRRNANRQPSVSNTMTRTAGKQTTIARRQESWTIEARIAAGSFVATRTASRPTPSTSRATRTWRRSALPVEDQQDADRRERARPEPPGNPRLGRRQSELEPAGPADEHPEQA